MNWKQQRKLLTNTFLSAKIFAVACVRAAQTRGLEFAQCPLLYVPASNVSINEQAADLRPNPPVELVPLTATQADSLHSAKLQILISDSFPFKKSS